MRYGRIGVRRIETIRRETITVRAASRALYAAFGTSVNKMSVKA